MQREAMLDYDKHHIWHPYTSLTRPLPVYPVVSASGVRLRLADGRELIDGMASWWCVIHGYNNTVLNRAMTEQLSAMSHVMFGGITHPQAVCLAEKLVDLTPMELNKVFFCDSGSVAVEVAIKMAMQYWFAIGRPGKNRLLTIRHGYHGDTFGAMSVCDPSSGMHHMFSRIVSQQLFADAPQSRTDADWDEADILSMQTLIEQHHEEVAAVILEPIVQGAGGMRFYAPEYLRRIRCLCDRYDILLIFDEIATGFGRTGKLFAMQHAEVCPDILCVGKALTGGYLSFAAVLTTDKVSSGICREPDNVFMHGPTYMANPLACAVANASLDLLLGSEWQRKITRIAAILEEELAPCWQNPKVFDVRVLGGIGVVEMKEAVDVAELQEHFVARGVWVRPFGKLVYVMPPYIIEERDLRYLAQQIVAVLLL